MSASNPRFLRLVAATAALTACTTGQQHLAEPAAGPMEGATTIAQAAQEANAGRYGVADKLLSDYAVRYPSTSEATDATYWRALYRIDPANQNASPREAAQLLDNYLASNNGTHKTEAQSLRRIVGAIEARTTAAANSPAMLRTEPAKPEDRSKDDELQKVKVELAKANAEL